MNKRGRDRILQVAVTSGAGILVALFLWLNGFLAGWDDRVWDLESRWFAETGAHSNEIVLVLVDQKSLDWVQTQLGVSWPWPRELYGAILDNFRRHQAMAVGFDVLLTEPSSFGVDDDQALGKAIESLGRFAAGSVFPGRAEGLHRQWPVDVPLPSPLFSAGKGRVPLPFPVYGSATMPIKEVAGPASILCNVHQDPDRDGIYRSLHPLAFFDHQPLPGLGVGVYLAAHPESRMVWEAGSITVDGKMIPVDSQGRTLLRFRGPAGTFFSISAASLLAEELALREGRNEGVLQGGERLRDKYVLFGFSAPGLFDLRPTPVGGIFSGVEINATLLDNLLSNDFITRVDMAWEIIVLSLVIFFGGILSAFYTGPAALSGLSLFFFLLPPALAALYHRQGWRLDFLLMESGLFVTIGLAIFLDYLREGKRRRFIKHSFCHYLSPHVIEQLIEHPEKLQLGGERRELSIFFSDLQGFTTISEGLEPEMLTGLLNTYLSAMTDIILEEDGTVDKYEGDAIIAFWNAPIDVADHAVRAVRAALRCQEKLAELRPLFREQYGHELYMRIGINSGPAVVGNLGSSTRFDYTMLGDAVNLAARLEGANKQFGTYLMISQSSREQINDAFPCRELARLIVVGRKEPIRVYEPFLAERFQQEEARYRTFDQGREAFYQGRFQDAIAFFTAIVDQDPPSVHYLDKCREKVARNPEKEWQGVWALASK
ncbi:MAG: adenylate/guanylate cyclase domain-containing protein [Proteobacteria bacterium]|nr:adenylate/guanylate cyclase domain-containing protein [Pseudomonadota bacterium]MBU1649700.1 adenylate/guanylate cyclase domain-containing protein [Pseudomonadota bacterium]